MNRNSGQIEVSSRSKQIFEYRWEIYRNQLRTDFCLDLFRFRGLAVMICFNICAPFSEVVLLILPRNTNRFLKGMWQLTLGQSTGGKWHMLRSTDNRGAYQIFACIVMCSFWRCCCFGPVGRDCKRSDKEACFCSAWPASTDRDRLSSEEAPQVIVRMPQCWFLEAA